MQTFKNFLKEASIFGTNWQYIVPKDFQTMLSDFYAFVACSNLLGGFGEFDKSNKYVLPILDNLQQALETSSFALKQYLLHLLAYCCASELKHLGNGVGSEYIPAHARKATYGQWEAGAEIIQDIQNKFAPNAKRNISSNLLHPLVSSHPEVNDDFTNQEEIFLPKRPNIANLKALINHYGSMDKFMEFAADMFSKNIWNELYGGAAWHKVTVYYFKLRQANTLKDVIYYIDRIVDLEHNTGMIFDKVWHIVDEQGSHEWIPTLLDKKTNSPIPYGYYKYLSPSAQKIISAFLYLRLGISLEDYKKAEQIIGYPEEQAKKLFNMSDGEFQRISQIADNYI